MAETSFPVAGGGGVTEDTYERLMTQFMGVGRTTLPNGLGDPVTTGYATPMVYADSTGRQVKIRANSAYVIHGYRWEAGTEDVIVALDANTSGKTRIDRIVLRLDRSTYTIRAGKLTGTPADAPVAPALTRSLNSTGLYEVAIGLVTVKSQSGTNLPSIAAGDVTDQSLYLTPPGHVGANGWPVPTLAPGETYVDPIKQQIWGSAGNGNIIIGERGPLTKIAASGGWTDDFLYAQRINGWTYFQGYIKMSTATTDKAPGTDLLVCTLPFQFRQAVGNFYTPVWMNNQVGACHFNGATGAVHVTAYGSTFVKGGGLVIGPVTYPSNGV